MITMLLKHLRGFGLFTSAHIKFHDANNLFDVGVGEAKSGLNLPTAKNELSTTVLHCYFPPVFIQHGS